LPGELSGVLDAITPIKNKAAGRGSKSAARSRKPRR
jgi:hypothetical protein